jgi:hypothetical protein
MLWSEPTDIIVIIRSAKDGFFEYGWIAGNSCQLIFINQFLQFTTIHDLAVKKIEPNTLAEVM